MRRPRIVVPLLSAVVLLFAALLAIRALRGDPERSASAVGLEARSYEVGQCLTWDQGGAGATSQRAETVPCEEEHLREVVGLLSLDDVRGGYPSEQEWDHLEDRCIAVVERHLGRYVNSFLHPLVHPTIKPSPASWAAGDRELVCEVGLRQVDLVAKRARLRPAFRGRVVDLGIVSPFVAGDCIRAAVGGELGTVPCDEPHRYEVTGIVDLRDPATTATEAAEVVAIEREVCPEQLRAHLGGEPEAGLLWTRLAVDQQALDGGVRGLVCMAQRFVDGSQVDLLGPLVP